MPEPAQDPTRPELEELVARLVAEADDPQQAFSSSPLRDDPRALAIFESIMTTQAELDLVGREVRADLAAAEHGGPAPGEAGLEDLVRSLQAQSAPGPRALDAHGAPRTRWWLAAAAVAASLLAAVLWLDPFGRRHVSERTFLGQGRDAVRPSGLVDEFGTFQWPAVVGVAGWYELRIVDREGTEILRTRCERETWDPEGALAGRDWIHWEVQAYDGSSAEPLLDTFGGEAWLSSADSR